MIITFPFADYAVINPANMWTKPDVKLFKQEVTSGKGDGVIRVGHGDTVTVSIEQCFRTVLD